jgi:hypothetical protein
MVKLNFTVQVESLGRPLDAQRDWERIAKRIARAAKGRSRSREAQVWAGGVNVFCDGDGEVEVRRSPQG